MTIYTGTGIIEIEIPIYDGNQPKRKRKWTTA